MRKRLWIQMTMRPKVEKRRLAARRKIKPKQKPKENNNKLMIVKEKTKAQKPKLVGVPTTRKDRSMIVKEKTRARNLKRVVDVPTRKDRWTKTSMQRPRQKRILTGI